MTLILAAVLISLGFSGCIVEQTLVLEEDLSGDWAIEVNTKPFITETLDSLAAFGGYQNTAELYEQGIINAERNMALQENIQDFNIKRNSDHQWNAAVQFTDIETLLGEQDSEGIAELVQTDSNHILTLRFDRNRAVHLENLFPLLKDPAFSLVNPAGTAGLSEEDYITGILGFTFGHENIPAVRDARIIMNIIVPRPVTQVRGGRQTGVNSVRFEIPFTKFMVPDDEIQWEVTWSSSP